MSMNSLSIKYIYKKMTKRKISVDVLFNDKDSREKYMIFYYYTTVKYNTAY